MLRRGASSFFSICDAIKSKRWLCLILLLSIGLISALFVNQKFYHDWVNDLPQEAIEKMDNHQDYIYMNARLAWMDFTMESVTSGKAYTVNDHEMSLYYYGAVLAKVVGLTSAWQVFLFIQMAAASLAVFLYPLLTYQITGSLACSLASPVLLHLLFGDVLYKQKHDTIWAYAWIIIIALPLVFLFLRRNWDVKKWALLLAIGALAGMSNVIRSQSALPILVLLGLCFAFECCKALRQKTPKQCIPYAAAALLLFFTNSLCLTWIPTLCFSSFGFQALHFQPWHTLYIGLGWQPNPYQLEFSDGIGYAAATRVEAVPYYSQRYFEILKAEYLGILKENPAFFFLTYAKKFLACCQVLLSYLLTSRAVVLLSSGAALLYCGVQSFVRKALLPLAREVFPLFGAALACAFLGMIPALIALPDKYYLYGSMASCSMILFCLLLIFIKGLAGQARRIRPLLG